MVELAERWGRIIRGTKPEHFETTAGDDLKREIVMAFGPDSFQVLAQLYGRDKLIALGYTLQHIEDKVNKGYRFKQITFSTPGIALLATWENITLLASEVYPDFQDAFFTHFPYLKTTPFALIQSQSGLRFFELDNQSTLDPVQQFAESTRDAIATRLFYYRALHLRELFRGDGYTYTHDGKRGVKEYAMRNRLLSTLEECLVEDIPVI